MSVKILQAPVRKGDSAIVTVNGKLRVIDPPKRCKGYQNCCKCKRCVSHEGKSIKRPNVMTCRCDHPMGISQGDCFKCGKPMAWTSHAQARAA